MRDISIYKQIISKFTRSTLAEHSQSSEIQSPLFYQHSDFNFYTKIHIYRLKMYTKTANTGKGHDLLFNQKCWNHTLSFINVPVL